MDYEIIVDVYEPGPTGPIVKIWRRWQLLAQLSERGWDDDALEKFNEALRPDAVLIDAEEKEGHRTYHVKSFQIHARS